jgi:ribosomal protein S6E (S10)
VIPGSPTALDHPASFGSISRPLVTTPPGPSPQQDGEQRQPSHRGRRDPGVGPADQGNELIQMQIQIIDG